MLTGSDTDMRKVQATQAKAHLAELLKCVERGETIAITRYGQSIAHLVPAQNQEQELRQSAIDDFRTKRSGWKRQKLSEQEILALRHEGHHR